MSGSSWQISAGREPRRAGARKHWFAVALLCAAGTVDAGPVALLPLPNQITAGKGVFRISAGTQGEGPAGEAGAAEGAPHFFRLGGRTPGIRLGGGIGTAGPG